jgi:hypothetical protein
MAFMRTCTTCNQKYETGFIEMVGQAIFPDFANALVYPERSEWAQGDMGEQPSLCFAQAKRTAREAWQAG